MKREERDKAIEVLESFKYLWEHQQVFINGHNSIGEKLSPTFSLALSALQNEERLEEALKAIEFWSTSGSGKTYSNINKLAKQALTKKEE